MLYMLSIEIDPRVRARPWVAAITGRSCAWGLAREFVRPMHDHDGARVACSGRLYGKVAVYSLRPGLYEVQRPAGSKSRRYNARSFLVVDETGRCADATEAEVMRALDAAI